MRGKAGDIWMRFWMRWAGRSRFGRLATRLATWTAPPFLARQYLATLNPNGYVAPSATLYHNELKLGRNVFIGDRVVIFQDTDGGAVHLADRIRILDETYFETGTGGSIRIGPDTHVHPRCFISAYDSAVLIGSNVLISAHCAFYPYDHGFAPGVAILDQPVETKGDITIGDGAWLGYGVVVLSGVTIGRGAVVGAGSVVTKSVPDGAIVAGVPARVVKLREDLRPSS